MSKTYTFGGQTYTVDDSATFLSVSSHPVLGIQAVHFQMTQPIPEGATAAQTAAILSTNGNRTAGQTGEGDRYRTTVRNR